LHQFNFTFEDGGHDVISRRKVLPMLFHAGEINTETGDSALHGRINWSPNSAEINGSAVSEKQ